MEQHPPHTLPQSVIYLFFAIGIIAAIAFRLLIIIQHVKPELFRFVWYVGVFGYIVFFLYRYIIARKRKLAIKQYQLIEKLKQNVCLTEEDREVIFYLLYSIQKSRENVNYLFIFILSGFAVLADIILSA